MTDILMFKVHSVLGEVTNSSSELFICNTSMKKKKIRKLVEDLVRENPGIQIDLSEKMPTYEGALGFIDFCKSFNFMLSESLLEDLVDCAVSLLSKEDAARIIPSRLLNSYPEFVHAEDDEEIGPLLSATPFPKEGPGWDPKFFESPEYVAVRARRTVLNTRMELKHESLILQWVSDNYEDLDILFKQIVFLHSANDNSVCYEGIRLLVDNLNAIHLHR